MSHPMELWLLTAKKTDLTNGDGDGGGVDGGGGHVKGHRTPEANLWFSHTCTCMCIPYSQI